MADASTPLLPESGPDHAADAGAGSGSGGRGFSYDSIGGGVGAGAGAGGGADLFSNRDRRDSIPPSARASTSSFDPDQLCWSGLRGTEPLVMPKNNKEKGRQKKPHVALLGKLRAEGMLGGFLEAMPQTALEVVSYVVMFRHIPGNNFSYDSYKDGVACTRLSLYRLHLLIGLITLVKMQAGSVSASTGSTSFDREELLKNYKQLAGNWVKGDKGELLSYLKDRSANELACIFIFEIAECNMPAPAESLHNWRGAFVWLINNVAPSVATHTSGVSSSLYPHLRFLMGSGGTVVLGWVRERFTALADGSMSCATLPELELEHVKLTSLTHFQPTLTFSWDKLEALRQALIDTHLDDAHDEMSNFFTNWRRLTWRQQLCNYVKIVEVVRAAVAEPLSCCAKLLLFVADDRGAKEKLHQFLRDAGEGSDQGLITERDGFADAASKVSPNSKSSLK